MSRIQSEDRRQRLAAALRANLKKRKAQARAHEMAQKPQSGVDEAQRPASDPAATPA